MQILNQKGNKTFIIGDLKFSTNLANPPPVILDYLHTVENNGFCNLITLPTRVTPDSETIIDHILINVTETAITPGVLLDKISDHYSIYCLISIPTLKIVKSVTLIHMETSNYLMTLNFLRILRFPLLRWSVNC